jgi:hypothetical protein
MPTRAELIVGFIAVAALALFLGVLAVIGR